VPCDYATAVCDRDRPRPGGSAGPPTTTGRIDGHRDPTNPIPSDDSGTLSRPMDRQTTFLLALGMLVAASLAVGVSGWVLFLRDRALHKLALASAHDDHHEVAEEP
jgi:hypothetical protein